MPRMPLMPRPQDFDESIEYAEAIAEYQYKSEWFEEYENNKSDMNYDGRMDD